MAGGVLANIAKTTSSSASAHIRHLDMLRGCAAILVLATHLRAYLFVDFGTLAAPGILARCFYAITGLGSEAVIVFFALSGYLVGGQALNQMLVKRWGWRRYLLRRFTRLWVVVLPALALTFGLDYLGQFLNGGAGYDGSYRDLYQSSSYFVSRPDHSIATLLGNILFLQKILVPVYGSNGPMWSLSFEFWYYIAVPLAASLVLVPARALNRVGNALLLLLIIILLPRPIIVLASVWAAGAAARWFAENPNLEPVFRQKILSAAILAVSGLVFVYGKIHGGESGTLVLGFAVATALPFVAHLPNAGKTYNRLGESLAKISYSLYLVHFPFISLVVLVWIAPYRRNFGFVGLAMFVLIFVAAVCWSTLIWWCFERRTDSVFRYLDLRLPHRLPSLLTKRFG
jgi:peptidoglycan/LPS O-acetylase OafA/YrhL